MDINDRHLLYKIVGARDKHLEEAHDQPIEKDSETFQVKVIDSPLGVLTLRASSQTLLGLSWGDDKSKMAMAPDSLIENEENSILIRTELQLKEYFDGKRSNFDIPLSPSGTVFQKQVWQELLKISYGQPISYGEQARRLGRPKAARAVGAANGKNPIGIIIPCHRVIGASGHLTGFAGGLEIKRKLLVLEGFLKKSPAL
jgi:methylated-DNA-[protein]-cysteine S-methyltransferase